VICSNGFAIRRRGNVMSSASQRAESRFRKPIGLRYATADDDGMSQNGMWNDAVRSGV
jgi:hypothetical protein